MSEAQFQQIMAALADSQARIEEKLDEKLEKFKGEVREGQEKVAASAVRRVRRLSLRRNLTKNRPK